MIEWLSPPTRVAFLEFHTTREWSLMRFPQNGAFCLDVALPFHIWLWVFMSPAMITWLCLVMASQFTHWASRSPLPHCRLQSYTLTMMIEAPLGGLTSRACA